MSNVPSRVEITDAENPRIVNLQYAVLAFIMLGQAAMLASVLLGQVMFLVCNILACYRVFALGRPTADKVKDICCLALTLSLILLSFL
jgi:hypothetical protein